MAGNVARELPAGTRSGATKRNEYVIEAARTDLPPVVRDLADRYDEVVGDRDRFVWKWIHNLFDAFTLSCVPGDRLTSVKTTKTVLTMFITVLDDLADRRGNAATFEQARYIPQSRGTPDPEAPGVDTDVIAFAESLWEAFRERLTDAPRAGEFDDLLAFDVRQSVAAMEYARVLNDRPEMANLAGSRHYGPHNMVMFPYADVDLMYSPGFETAELGRLRSLVWELQPMARIGNWVTTWERELREADFSAGVVVAALERELIEPVLDTTAQVDEAIETIQAHGIERQFTREWRERFADARGRDWDLDSVEADDLVEGMRTVMEHHVASYGHK